MLEVQNIYPLLTVRLCLLLLLIRLNLKYKAIHSDLWIAPYVFLSYLLNVETGLTFFVPENASSANLLNSFISFCEFDSGLLRTGPC